MKHTPVRYLDRLNTLIQRVRTLSYAIEPTDPIAFQLLHDIETQMQGVTMALNRKGPEREQYVSIARGRRLP